jgi:oligopeptide transport system substrate-binding protein
MRISARRPVGAGIGLPAALLALTLTAMANPAAADITLRRGLVGSIETLDPQRAATFEETMILTDLFDGLVSLDALGRAGPGAAESWTVSPDGLIYTFKLRKGGRWSNGQAVKAEDFVQSFRRLFSPGTDATEDGPLQVIRNAVPVKEGLAKPDSLGVAALDVATLEITLEQPTPTFPRRLAEPVALPVNVSAIRKLGDDFGKTGNIVSNGPYRLGAIDAEDGYVLLKNDRFRAADQIEADSVVYQTFADAADCVAAFRDKKVLTCSDVPTADLAGLKQEFGAALEIAPYEGTYFYALSTTHKPLDDVRVRQALSLAIDREALAREAWSGGMIAADHLVPRELSALPPAADEPIEQRRKRARSLLEAAGFGGKTKPLDVEIRVGTGAAHEQTAKLVAEDWKAIGVNATILTEPGSAHFARLRDGGDFEVARAGWILEEADPIDILSLLKSDNERFNYPRYNNRDYDELLANANAAIDPQARQKLLGEAETRIQRDQPVIPLLSYASLSLVSPSLRGWEPNVVNRHPSRFLRIVSP